MAKISLKHVSKRMSHALRHEPWLYELELDEEGWVSFETLLGSLRAERQDWRGLERSHIQELIRTAAKERFELKGERIRAIYGHSLPGALKHKPADPPEILYHGTTPALVEVIMAEGLKPMSRQFVHMSADIDTAKEVGRRKAGNPVLLKIRAKEAAAIGHAFYRGNDKVWLTSELDGGFLSV